jgi:hypothetical protein
MMGEKELEKEKKKKHLSPTHSFLFSLCAVCAKRVTFETDAASDLPPTLPRVCVCGFFLWKQV